MKYNPFLLWKTLFLTFICTLSLSATFSLAIAQAGTFVEVAQPRVFPAGAPNASDISIRGIFPRYRTADNPYDTIEAIKAFHATRLDWFSRLDKDFIAKVRQTGCSIQGSVAMAQYFPPLIPDPENPDTFVRGPAMGYPSGPAFEDLSILDIAGQAVVAPNMRAWPRNTALWGCINNPLVREGHLRKMQSLIDLGVDSIQQDASEMNHHPRFWGGCYCDYCIVGFREYIKKHNYSQYLIHFGIEDVNTFNYRDYLTKLGAPAGDGFYKWQGVPIDLRRFYDDFQAQASADYHRWWRVKLNQYAGRYVCVSANNYFGWVQPYYHVFDYGIRELNYYDANPKTIWTRMQEAAEIGKLQCFTMPIKAHQGETPEWIQFTCQTLATVYAAGGLMQVPWDTYMPFGSGKDSSRYFGKPENYAHLYAFIRACSQYFDDYQNAAVIGPDIDDLRWPEEKPIKINNGSGKVYAFARAIPGEPDKQIVIHLIDWADKPEPFRISINPEACFGGQPIKIRLVTPISYDKQAHETAWETKNYKPLVKWTSISQSLSRPLNIPSLSPWGILIIELDKGDSAQASTFVEAAQPRVFPAGAPKASEVSIRSLSPRRRSDDNPHDTIEAIKNFHATRLDWTYGMNEEFIDKVRSLNCTVQGTVAMAGYVNPDTVSTNDSNEYPGVSQPGGPAFEELSILDLDGMPVIAPWMRTWNFRALWGCINNPLAQAAHLRTVKKLIDVGVDSIQQDCPEMNHQPRFWGACFCDHCMIKFRGFLQSQNLTPDKLKEFGIDDLCTFSYRDLLKQQNAPVAKSVVNFKDTNEELKQLFFNFQAQSSGEFHGWWRNELNEYAGRYVPVSCNNYFGWDQPYYRVFDFGIRELKAEAADPSELYKRILYAAELGKTQLFTMPLRDDQAETPEWIELTNKTLATLYAIGSWMQAPWDTYMGGTTPRYFGSPEDHAHLYAMVRACAIYLDDYEDAAAFGPDIEDGRWASGKPIAIKDGSGKVYAFARAIPGGVDKPIVIHLIDWAEKPEPFTLSVDPNACFGDQKVTVRLATPVPYDKQAHEAAWETKNYQPLVRWTQISKGLSAPLNIPALSPWGILVIELDKGDAAQAGTFTEVAQR